VVTGGTPEAVFLVLERWGTDLASILDTATAAGSPFPFSPADVKTLSLQLFQALAFLHARCVLHRDVKLSNLLYCKGVLKLADFGMARNTSPLGGALTPRIVTLWYRAPELLLGAVDYTDAVDAWAAGCVMAELLRHRPVFPGREEGEMWSLLVALLGSPNQRIWPNWTQLPQARSLSMSCAPQEFNHLRREFSGVAPAGLELLNSLLCYDPSRRLGMEAAAHAEWFREKPLPHSPEAMPIFPDAFEGGRKRARTD